MNRHETLEAHAITLGRVGWGALLQTPNVKVRGRPLLGDPASLPGWAALSPVRWNEKLGRNFDNMFIFKGLK